MLLHKGSFFLILFYVDGCVLISLLLLLWNTIAVFIHCKYVLLCQAIGQSTLY